MEETTWQLSGTIRNTALGEEFGKFFNYQYSFLSVPTYLVLIGKEVSPGRRYLIMQSE